jgi:heat shock protein HslJ
MTVLRRTAVLLSLVSTISAARVSADADGPDFYTVTGVAPGHVLNLRAAPSTAAEKIGAIPHDGHGLRSLGCRGYPSFAEWQNMAPAQRVESGKQAWCKVRYRGMEGWVAGRYLREDSAPPSAMTPLDPKSFANLPYAGIYDQAVQLVDGVYEGEPFVAGGASRPRVELLTQLYATDDIDGDGTEDVWVLLNESSGGSGQFLYLAAVTYGTGEPRNVGTIGIGDRVDVMDLRAGGGQATLDYVAAGPEEAACCPTQMVSVVYGLAGDRLAELSRTPRGTLSLQQLAGTTWRLAGYDSHQPLADDILITAAFEDGRVAGSAGCNRYFAAVEAPTPYQLKVQPGGSTRMACPPPQMAAEDRYLAALHAATQYSFVLGRLAITYNLDGTYGTLLFERLEQD